MLAVWVVRTRGVKLGGEVGYQMRLDKVTCAATRICYLTEGVLRRRMLAQRRNLLIRRQAERIDDRRGDLFGDETESDFFVLMRAWKYAQRNGFDDELCRGMGIHAQAARQIGLLFEQFSSIAAAEGFDIREKPVAPGGQFT
jgi:hypothetical protein